MKASTCCHEGGDQDDLLSVGTGGRTTDETHEIGLAEGEDAQEDHVGGVLAALVAAQNVYFTYDHSDEGDDQQPGVLCLEPKESLTVDCED